MTSFPFLRPPWKHQEEIFERAKDMDDYALLMDMGTGKTFTTINLLRYKYYKQEKLLRTLVLCPIVMVNAWHREFYSSSKVGPQVIPLLGPGAKRQGELEKILASGESKIIVTNYESLQNDNLFRLLCKYDPTCIVFDESQKLKNYKAKRTQRAIKLADTSRFRYILSGTPILNNPMDIWAQYRILDGGKTFEQNFFVFRARYFMDKNAGMPKDRYFPNWQPMPSLAKTFNDLIYRKASRVMKSECLTLPPFVRKIVTVAMGGKQRKAYDEMRRDLVAYLNDAACVAHIALTKSLRLQQIVSGFAKMDDQTEVTFEDSERIDALSEVLEMTEGHKVIIWAVFKQNYGAIEKLLESQKIKFARLVGGMNDKDRQAGIDAFQTDPETRVMLANQQAGGVGVTLTAASYAVFFSRNFSLEADLQAEARNYRGGSQIHTSVTRIDIVCPDSIDEVVLEALKRKEDLANNILAIKGRDF